MSNTREQYKVELEDKKSGMRMVVEVEATSHLRAKSKAEREYKRTRALKAQTLTEYLTMSRV